MFIVVVAGLAVALFVLSRTPSTGQNGTVPPNQLLPPTGASPIQSPATTGANPMTSTIGKGIASVTTRLAGVVPGAKPAFVVPMPASSDFSGAKQLPTVSNITPIGIRKF